MMLADAGARALIGAAMLYYPFDLPMLPNVRRRREREPQAVYQNAPGFVPPITNGRREVARRLRQIQNGQLKVSA